MKTKNILASMLLLATLSAQAETPEWVKSIKLSGYGMTQYQYSNQQNAKDNTFNLRLLRLSLEGRVSNDFYWKAQMQINGNTSTLGSSPRLVDLFAEWQKYDFARVKVGQFKRPFTFDNPLHPIDQGFMSVGQAVLKLAGFSDRSGEQPSNGRDIGLQLQGDVLPNAEGRKLLHYQVGIFNGQGINTKDVDQRKDVIGGIWVMPVKGLRVGVFGWEGSVARRGTWNDAAGAHSGVRSLPKHRYALSGEYKVNDWTVRSEYVHSTGKAFSTAITNTNAQDPNFKNNNISALGDKADGLYGLVIAPVVKNKFHLKARYDLYRANAKWNHARTQYEVGADYLFHKNVQLNVEYARVNDRSLSKHNFNLVDVELDFRF
mgnify:FL=1